MLGLGFRISGQEFIRKVFGAYKLRVLSILSFGRYWFLVLYN